MASTVEYCEFPFSKLQVGRKFPTYAGRRVINCRKYGRLPMYKNRVSEWVGGFYCWLFVLTLNSAVRAHKTLAELAIAIGGGIELKAAASDKFHSCDL